MKKTKKYRVRSNGDDFATTGRHICFQHILAFAREGADFTKQESAHFDVCRACRLTAIDALRDVAPMDVRTTTPRAA
jgi:hypothetical protein